jgi:hypothetical protein
VIAHSTSARHLEVKITRLSDNTLSPGHTALYGLITAKARLNVISRKADKIKSNQIIFIQSQDKKQKIEIIKLIVLFNFSDFVCFTGDYVTGALTT